MEGYIWLILASMFAVGIIFGFFFGRGREVTPSTRIRELEEDLEQQKQDMDEYKAEVTEHFGKTAELFNQLTNDYRAVYEHLANSSEKLCGDQVEKLKALTADNAEKPAIESQSEQVAMESTVTEQSVDAAAEQGAENAEDVKPTDEIAAAEPTETEKAAAEEVSPAVTEESKLDEKAAEARTIH